MPSAGGDDTLSDLRIQDRIMTNDDTGASSGDGQIALIEALLGRYPHVSNTELMTLKTWFKTASALEVGQLASRADIAPGYRRFRAEHVDKLGAVELAIIAIVVALLGALVVFLV
jgi:hypothetical protein